MKCRGFSLLELLITVAIVAVFATWALPSLGVLTRSMQVTSSVNDLVSDLNAARSRAVKSGHVVALYANDDSDWSNGWSMWEDSNDDQIIDGSDRPLRRHAALRTGFALHSNGTLSRAAPLMFNAQGQRQSPAPAVSVAFVMCNPDGIAANARTVNVMPAGTIVSAPGIAVTGITCP